MSYKLELTDFIDFKKEYLNPICQENFGMAGQVLRKATALNINRVPMLTNPFFDIREIHLNVHNDMSICPLTNTGALLKFVDGTALLIYMDDITKPWKGGQQWQIVPAVFKPNWENDTLQQDAKELLRKRKEMPPLAWVLDKSTLWPVWDSIETYYQWKPNDFLNSLTLLKEHDLSLHKDKWNDISEISIYGTYIWDTDKTLTTSGCPCELLPKIQRLINDPILGIPEDKRIAQRQTISKTHSFDSSKIVRKEVLVKGKIVSWSPNKSPLQSSHTNMMLLKQLIEKDFTN
jgi:hypothetical protein